MYWQNKLTLRSSGRGTYEITKDIEKMIRDSGVQQGLCHLFIQHTSASLIISENADPAVRDDLETFISKICPDGDAMFTHRSEGDDDMPAHIKASVLGSSLTIPITNGELNLGTWQGIYLCEHRNHGGSRKVVVTIFGEE